MLHYSPSDLIKPPMLDRTISIAPMMGYTDRHCRYLLRLISAHSLLYTEMVVTGALVHGKAAQYLSHESDGPCALQLGGSNPEHLRQCARMAEDAGYQEVNLNVGCPSDRVQQGGIGACLMAQPNLVAECISAMQHDVSIPVTVKSRIGIDDDDSYELFHQFVSTVHSSGCKVFIVHARKALLNGLSPKENREIPPLKYQYVYDIKQDFPDATFVLNGGLKETASIFAALNRVDGVMLGRAPYADPWMLAELETAIYGQQTADRRLVLADYRNYVDRQVRAGENFKHMGRHLLSFFTGCPGARAFRRHLSEHMFTADATGALIDEALSISGLDKLDVDRAEPIRPDILLEATKLC